MQFFQARLSPTLQRNDDVFALGLANSLFALELIAFIEETCGFSVETEDLDADNFGSVDGVARFVQWKLAGTES